MQPNNILKAIIWLAVLGLVVILATRVVGKVGAKAAAVSPV